MNRKIYIAIIALILLITVAAFVWLWQAKNGGMTTGGNAPAAPQAKVVKPTDNKASSSATTSTTTADLDIKAIEDDLNSVGEDDFNETGLSDGEVGL